jgi:hypothetical protein
MRKGLVDMSEKPILFSGPMVRAIMDGSKTMTRRIVKPQPPPETLEMRLHGDEWLPCWEDDDYAGCYVAHGDMGHRRRCPYGRPGDRLWVRETFQDDSGLEFDMPMCVYRATDNTAATRWRPSIHMPRWASRITLEVVAVRVERLNDISAYDAISEGIDLTGATDRAARQSFQLLWESINGAGSWAANPWVWVVEFRRVEE